MLSRSGPVGRVAAVSAAAVLICVYAFLTGSDFAAHVGFCSPLFCDFIVYYYPMGEVILTSGVPVEGFLYSPFNAILMMVFPVLGLNMSLVLWGGAQIVAAGLYILLFCRLVPAGFGIRLLFVGLALTSYPLWLNFLAGNVGAFITVAVLGSLWAMERGRNTVAAVLIAFAASFKFYPLIFLAPFIARRYVRFGALAVVSSISVLMVIPGVVLGADGVIHYYSVLFDSLHASDWVAVNPHSQFLPHVALRWFGDSGATHSSLTGWYILSYILVTLNLILLYFVRRARGPRTDLWSFVVVFLTIPFILKTSWPMDFVFLPFVQTFLLWHLLTSRAAAEEWRKPEHSRRRHGLISLVILSSFLTNIVFFQLLGDFKLYGYGAFLLLANVLLLLVTYVELIPAVRPSGVRMRIAASRS